jgi:hypothetical protein
MHQRTPDDEIANCLNNHVMSHRRKNQTPVNKDIEWKIIHGNLVYEDKRKCIEAMEIQKHTGDLMNGCTSRTITI